MAKVGRKHRGYLTDDRSTTVHGLQRDRDGRWRIVATGFRFTEPDESRAIDKFYELTGQTKPLETQRSRQRRFRGALLPPPREDALSSGIDALWRQLLALLGMGTALLWLAARRFRGA